MSQFPDYPDGSWDPTYPSGSSSPPLKTSGLAITALACGAAGLVTCCAVIPSLLAVVFGVMARTAIRNGEAKGKGLATAGIVLGVIGMIPGVIIWYFLLQGPEVAPVRGPQVPQRQRETLRAIGALQEDEDITLFYASGMFSIKQDGVLITDSRLVIYGTGTQIEQCQLADISAIEFTDASSVFEEGAFILDVEGGDLITFTVTGQEDGDNLFHRVLTRSVTEAREAAGKPKPLSELPPVE